MISIPKTKEDTPATKDWIPDKQFAPKADLSTKSLTMSITELLKFRVALKSS